VAQQRLVFVGSIVQRFNVFVRDYQQVRWRLRIDIPNDYCRLVLMDQVGWNTLLHDLAKQATLFWHAFSILPY
jgi:hypothetical protein